MITNDTEALAALLKCFWINNYTNDMKPGLDWSFREDHTVKDENEELNEYLLKFIEKNNLKL